MAEEGSIFHRADVRIGQILTAEKHPNADLLYVEDVDIGEVAPRRVVSGLAGKIPLHDLPVIFCS